MNYVVAPHAGAWIETKYTQLCELEEYVAPHAGAWIETDINVRHGLLGGVAPHAGAWIETDLVDIDKVLTIKSHPMRVRGLKLMKTTKIGGRAVSHPMRVRGLKLCYNQNDLPAGMVAPHAGAWIETVISVLLKQFAPSHPMRVRGLKLLQTGVVTSGDGRTPCGCVD